MAVFKNFWFVFFSWTRRWLSESEVANIAYKDRIFLTSHRDLLATRGLS
jgi:hypothetical protein